MFRYLYRLPLHPVDSLTRLKEKRDEAWTAPALLAMLLLLLSSIIEFQYTDFAFNMNRVDQLNLWLMLFKTVGLLLLWVLSNWAFCTLFDGEGPLKQIFCLSCFALLPYAAALLLKTGLSIFLTDEEGVFLTWLLLFGEVYSGVLMLAGLHIVHGFTMGKTILTVIFTLLGMLIVLFIMTLLFSLLQQFLSFFMTIFSELSLMIGG